MNKVVNIKSFTILSLMILMLPCFAFSQFTMTKANKFYKDMAYSRAIPLYEKSLIKDPQNEEAMIKLADCYRLTNNSQKAEEWFLKVVKLDACRPIYKFHYAQALMENGKYEEANRWMKDYDEYEPRDDRGEIFINSIDNLDAFNEESGRYHIEPLGINTKDSDFGISIYKRGIVFTSSRAGTEWINRSQAWTGGKFYTLYYSKGRNGKFTPPELFSASLKSKYNDGPACFSEDGKQIVFTRNNKVKQTDHKCTENTIKLNLFEGVKTKEGWGNVKAFKYNSNHYNTAHPSMSIDGNYLYFSSNMPGGYGGMDLYVCFKEGKKWGKPKNLGSKINTEGNDVFPYIHDDGALFFASDGHEGIGGLDIYAAKFENGDVTMVKNLGTPVNSEVDDFGLVYDNETQMGYFSSNRNSKGDDDDLFTFKKELILKGVVVLWPDDIPIEDALVELVDSASGERLQLSTIDDGKFEFPLDYNKNYSIQVTKEGLGTASAELSTVDISPADDPYVKLEFGKRELDYNLIVKIFDAADNSPLQHVRLRREDDGTILGYTNEKGEFRSNMDENTSMNILVTKRGFGTKRVSVSNKNMDESKDFIFSVDMKPGPDIFPHEEWYKIIYYGFNKYSVSTESQIIMKEVINFMKENPTIKIGLSSHTDSRGNQYYNKGLSERRTKAAAKHLLDNGIHPDRIAKLDWMGETLLVNHCEDGILCSERDHALNRRTEFYVVGFVPEKK